MEERRLALVCSVGTTPEPIEHALDTTAREGCQQVWLLYGRQLAGQAPSPFEVAAQAKRSAETRGLRASVWEIPDPQSFESACAEFRRAIEEASRLGAARIVCDLTGGTKAMSAALAFQALSYRGPSEVSIQYIGGERGDPAGRVTGAMIVLQMQTWRVLEGPVLAALQDFRWAEAAALASLLPQAGRPGALREAVGALWDWDQFDYQAAHRYLANRATQRAWAFLGDSPGFARLLEWLGTLQARSQLISDALSSLDGLEKAKALKPQELPPGLVDGLGLIAADALANARRRLAEQRYTDCVLRAYRAVEVATQHGLLARGYNPWNMAWTQPADLAARVFGPGVGEDLPTAISMDTGLRVLDALHPGVLEGWRSDLRALQQMRNYCFLEHGYQKSTEDQARKAVALGLRLAARVSALVAPEAQAQFEGHVDALSFGAPM